MERRCGRGPRCSGYVWRPSLWSWFDAFWAGVVLAGQTASGSAEEMDAVLAEHSDVFVVFPLDADDGGLEGGRGVVDRVHAAVFQTTFVTCN